MTPSGGSERRERGGAMSSAPGRPKRPMAPSGGSEHSERGGMSIRGTQLLHVVRWRLELGAVEVGVVHHHALALVVLRLTDEGAHGRLMVVGTEGDLAERG